MTSSRSEVEDVLNTSVIIAVGRNPIGYSCCMYFTWLSKVSGFRPKLLPIWLVSASYSAWHFFTDRIFKLKYDWTLPLILTTQPPTSKLYDNPALNVLLFARQFPSSLPGNSLCCPVYVTARDIFLGFHNLMCCCYCISKVRLQTLKMIQWRKTLNLSSLAI